jgi:hypothetical protein
MRPTSPEDDRNGPPVAPRGELLLANARVVTGDTRRSVADAVLVRGDRVIAVGSTAELRKRLDPQAAIVDARGMVARSPTAGDVLAPGSPANIVVIARDAGALESSSASDAATGAAIVFELVEGRITIDRLSA